MPPPILPVQVTLIFLCALGGFLTWGFALKNGTIDMMAHIRDFGPHVLPGTTAALKKSYTGIEAIDYQLTVLDLFFWEMVDGSMPNASLGVFRFASQFAAIWGLVMIEGMRAGNKGRLVSYAWVWGMTAQNATYAMTMPYFFVVYLATSPTVSATKASVMTDIAEVASIPFSIIAGYVIPAVMLALPAPSLQNYENKQIWMAIWQASPIWVSCFQQIFKRVIGFLFPAAHQPSSANSMEALRHIYSVLLVMAGVPHILSAALTITSMIFPSIFAPEYVGMFNLSKVAIPSTVMASTKMPNIGSGAYLLLQYDEMIGSTAVVLWASFMWTRANNSNKPFDKLPNLIGLIALLVPLTGPAGCAITLMWLRDELVFAEKSQ